MVWIVIERGWEDDMIRGVYDDPVAAEEFRLVLDRAWRKKAKADPEDSSLFRIEAWAVTTSKAGHE